MCSIGLRLIETHDLQDRLEALGQTLRFEGPLPAPERHFFLEGFDPTPGQQPVAEGNDEPLFATPTANELANLPKRCCLLRPQAP